MTAQLTSSSPTGVLLINLGTPDDPQPPAVRRYLKQFLEDPYVIDLPALLRWLLVNGGILPFRTSKSAAAYQQIWLPDGSPLLVYSQQLADAVAQELGDNYRVALGMRYGKPSLATALQQLQSCAHIIILPLFPHYSIAATQSALDVCTQHVAHWRTQPRLSIMQSFYDHPAFIAAYAEVIRTSLSDHPVDKLLLSYHGLPQRQINKICTHRCVQSACPEVNSDNALCYRAQCFATARALITELQLPEQHVCVTFQSRLGRTPWIQPYTDVVLTQLIQQNVRDIAVACPSFVVDCLETLEEIGLRAKEQWRQLGGGTFTLVPALNAHPLAVQAFTQMVRAYHHISMDRETTS